MSASLSCSAACSRTSPARRAHSTASRHVCSDSSCLPAYSCTRAASLNARAVLPTTRVEYALRGDDALTEGDVRELMQAYLTTRQRRLRASGNGGAPNGYSTHR